ncbi:YcnI family protein [Aeromicrobium sp.]|uniref:YcnI family copper-binding membrane protein n=1 Tax=Aeromicrobium sp. TaxID=1871063 RepID=UPI0030BEFB7C
MIRTTARLSAALFTVALVGIAAPASAHVSVSSTDAAKGGFGKAVFRVPTESETASTTKLVVTLPQGTPLAFVSAGAKPGWKVTIAKQKLDEKTKVGDFELTEAVSSVTWTSTGGGVAPGQFDEFAISGGPFPDADAIAFTAEQTYSDGEVVRWDDVQSGDEEPEHPAPSLALAAASEGGHGASDAKPAASTVESEADDAGNSLATWLSGSALVTAVGALLVALRQNRHRA